MNQTKDKIKLLRNTRIGMKLRVGFLTVTLFIIVLAFNSIVNMKNLSHQVNILQQTSDVELSMMSARVEQVRYEAEGKDESIKLVTEYLDRGKSILEVVKPMMKDKNNKAKVDNIFTNIEVYQNNFDEFTELERQKAEQDTIRAQVALEADSSMAEMLALQEAYIKTLTNTSEIQESYNKYLVLKEAMENYTQARIATSKYVETEALEDLEILKSEISKVETLLTQAKSMIKNKEILDHIVIAETSLHTYKLAVEQYSDLVQQQQSQKIQLHESANNVSVTAKQIEEGILSYIDRLEQSSKVMSISVAIVCILLSLSIAFVITRSIVKPLAETVNIMDTIANYRITDNVPVYLLERKDEVGKMANALQKVITSLREILIKINYSSERVGTSSQELSSISSQVEMTSDNIAKSVEGIAEGAIQQAKDIELGVGSINNLGSLIQKDRLSVEKLKDAAIEVKQLKDEGIILMEELVSHTQKNQQSLEYVYETVKDTNKSVKEIENASKMIRNIATQTNLLALNASIEAARAGEGGRGFAVVAEEVGKLAEQSNLFTNEISNIIESLLEKSNNAVTEIEDNKMVSEAQYNSVNHTKVKFEGISSAVELMEEMILNVIESSHNMGVNKDEIIHIIETLAAISEENAASTEQSSAAIQEQTASISEISIASNELARLAEEMQEVVNRFVM